MCFTSWSHSPPPHHHYTNSKHGFITLAVLCRVEAAFVFLKPYTMAPLSALIDILSIEDIKWDLSFHFLILFVFPRRLIYVLSTSIISHYLFTFQDVSSFVSLLNNQRSKILICIVKCYLLAVSCILCFFNSRMTILKTKHILTIFKCHTCVWYTRHVGVLLYSNENNFAVDTIVWVCLPFLKCYPSSHRIQYTLFHSCFLNTQVPPPSSAYSTRHNPFQWSKRVVIDWPVFTLIVILLHRSAWRQFCKVPTNKASSTNSSLRDWREVTAPKVCSSEHVPLIPPPPTELRGGFGTRCDYSIRWGFLRWIIPLLSITAFCFRSSFLVSF